jgi:hypothetical protein
MRVRSDAAGQDVPVSREGSLIGIRNSCPAVVPLLMPADLPGVDEDERLEAINQLPK